MHIVKNYIPDLAGACNIVHTPDTGLIRREHLTAMQTTLLDQFGFLAIRGKDAISFLQGYTTCDLESVTDSRAVLGAVCNIQGRMVTNFRVCKIDDGLLLRLDRQLVEKTMSFLTKYIVFSKAEMSDMSENYVCYGLIGDVDGSNGQAINDVSTLNSNLLIRVSETSPRYEAWVEANTDVPVYLPGDLTSDQSEWQRAEINDGLAWTNSDSSEEYIPQMFNLHELGGIDFEKGCYLGQEIIARLEYRGQLKRKLHRGLMKTSIEVGSSLLSDTDKDLGAVVNVANLSDGYSILAVLKNGSDDALKVHAEAGNSAELKPI
jgi:folate-binding protein YgfZ